jgi:hypothetical protein
MFWIPDFAAAAADLLAADPTADPAISARVEFLRSLAAGEPPDPDASWPLDLVVDEPERGLTSDPAAVADLLGASARWQEQRKTKARWSSTTPVGPANACRSRSRPSSSTAVAGSRSGSTPAVGR